MIQIQNLSKIYNGVKVLNISDLAIPKGECFGLVGNNGAGKTTLFSLLLDLIQANSGTVKIKDIDVAKSEDWKPYTSAFLDDSFLIGYLKPEEYFYFIGDLRGWDKTLVDDFLKQFERIFDGEILGRNRYIRDLSKGNAKKVGIVGALIGNPELVILDEPFANLDPSTQIRFKELFKTYSKEQGTTLLISSHDLSHTVEVCDRIVALQKGEIIKDIATSENTLKELEAFFGEYLKEETEETSA